MCIIVIKPKGKEMPNTLETCFKNNPDGAGIMYQIKDYVKIEKGFMTYEKLKKRLDTLDKKLNLKDKNLILHFRIGTSGAKDKHTTHPFPISENEKELKMLSLKTNIGLVHNGIISDYVGGALSDTQNFVKDYVSMLYDLNNDFLDNDRVLKAIKNECGSKLAFLDNKDRITTIGEFTTDNGIIYSNSSYNSYSYYSKYDYKYDSYYDNYSKYSDYYDYTTYGYDISDLEKGEEIMNYKDLMIIDNDTYIQKSNGICELNKNFMAIDKDHNLYEIIDYFDDYDYIVKKVDIETELYDINYKPIEFEGGI